MQEETKVEGVEEIPAVTEEVTPTVSEEVVESAEVASEDHTEAAA